MIFYHATNSHGWTETQEQGYLLHERRSEGSLPSPCTHLAAKLEDARKFGEFGDTILLEVEYDPTINPKMNNYVPGCWQLRVYEPIYVYKRLLPMIDPSLRTPAVMALCRRMLNARDKTPIQPNRVSVIFDAMSLLADALREAGCTDKKLLDDCEISANNYHLAERLVCQLYSAETEDAIRYLDRFAGELGYRYDYSTVIGIGHDGIKDGHIYFSTTNGPDELGSVPKCREFYRNWSLVTGISVSDGVIENLGVSCSC